MTRRNIPRCGVPSTSAWFRAGSHPAVRHRLDRAVTDPHSKNTPSPRITRVVELARESASWGRLVASDADAAPGVLKRLQTGRHVGVKIAEKVDADVIDLETTRQPVAL